MPLKPDKLKAKPDKLKAKAGSGKTKGVSGPSYSDDNAKWLKPKKVDLFADADADDEEPPPAKVAKAAAGKPKVAKAAAGKPKVATPAGRTAAARPAAKKPAPAAAKPTAAAAARPAKRKQPPAPVPGSDEEEEGADEFEMGEADEESEDEEQEEQVVRSVRRPAASFAGVTGGSEDDSESEGGSASDEAGSEGGSDELDFERKARATVARLAAESKMDAAELLKQEASFTMPSGAQLEAEALAPPDIPALKARVADVVEVLGDFAARRQPDVTRADYVALLAADLQICYGYNAELVDLLLQLFSPAEALEFITASEKPRPVTIRTNTLKTRRKELAQALIARNVSLDPISKWSTEGLQIYESAVPIGATPEYLAGHYMIQSASSFLPVLALDVQPGQRILDMAASPGGKTSHIAARMANQGTLVANDWNKQRIPALASNLARQGVRCAITLHADGREFPKLMGGFDRVLLDAPCTGLGVISKDPAVKAEKGFSDIQRCQQLQKELLLAAIDSCSANAPGGGIVVYSTCSIAVEENEFIVDYALSSRSVKLVDTGLPFGVEGMCRYRSKRFHASLRHARRFYPHTHNMDGFFVAKFRKFSNALPAAEPEHTPGEVLPAWQAAAAPEAVKGSSKGGKGGAGGKARTVNGQAKPVLGKGAGGSGKGAKKLKA